jgi:tetraacyldisaccharide 4'-kinase
VSRQSGWAGRIEAGLGRLWWQPRPSALAQCLRPLAWCFGAVSALRRAGFSFGLLRAQATPVPVLVVGNLVAGGAGKTPTVIALVQALRAAGWSPGVISRGHGRTAAHLLEVTPRSTAQAVGDEPLLIRLRCGVPVFVARRRIDAAQALCAAHPQVDVLLADDGLQHLQLQRQAQVIVIDERGIGNGLLLPAGPLRQRLPKRAPPHTQVLYNASRPTTALAGSVVQRVLAGAVLLGDWWDGQAASVATLHALRGRPLLAAAGIASPQRFFDMLRDEGLVFQELPLPDHHNFNTLPWRADTPHVLVTEKDAVKLPPQLTSATRVWVVTLDFHLPAPFVAAVLADLGRPERTTPRP